jgi:hypothetical protein
MCYLNLEQYLIRSPVYSLQRFHNVLYTFHTLLLIGHPRARQDGLTRLT